MKCLDVKKWILPFAILIAGQALSGDFESGLLAYKKKNYREARKVWEELAGQGDSRSQLWLGAIHILGKGTSKNYAKGYEWLIIASDSYPLETRMLIDMIWPYLDAQERILAAKRASKWKACNTRWDQVCLNAFQGDPQAQYRVGCVFFMNSGPVDYSKAAEWFHLAAAQGNAQAQFKLGLLYDAGLGIGQSDRQAQYWYERAARAGVVNAWVMLGSLYCDNRNTGLATRGIRYFRMAAMKGNAIAQSALGEKYAVGDGVPVNSRESLQWLSQAADKGDTDAQNMLGTLYHTGRGVPYNPGQARLCFENAAQKGDRIAQYNLGLMHFQNSGTVESLAQAAKWFLRSARQGLPEACLGMGRIYLSGYRIRTDYIKAYLWCSLAASGQDRVVRDTARKLMQDMSRSMPFKDIVAAQKISARLWKEMPAASIFD
ncbi:sel1 repeat family protein [bacterium]|nr:sel1 repeat family protein [bacterium]